MTDYVAGFLVQPDPAGLSRSRLTLVRKSHPEWQRGRLNGVGGRVELGETWAEAMVREFAEEAGIRTPRDCWEYRLELLCGRRRTHWFVLFDDQGLRLPPPPRPDDDEPVDWYYEDGLPANILDNLRWIVPLCLDRRVRDVVRVSYASEGGGGETV
jgi:8-oxo-dGTP diphosphatase